MANSSVSFKYIYTYYLNKTKQNQKTCVSEIQDALGEGICSDFLVCLQFLMFKKMNGVRGVVVNQNIPSGNMCSRHVSNRKPFLL